VAEKNYVAVVKKKAHRPKTQVSYRRYLVYGRNKKGKTRFSLSAGVENTLLIDPEGGTDTMKDLNPYVFPVSKWEEVQEIYGALRTGKLSPVILELGRSKEPFSWVSVDGVTRLNNMALRYVGRKAEETNLDRRPGMVDRRDYNKSGELVKQMLLNFHALKMNVVYTAQERVISVDDDDETSEASTLYVPDLPQGARGAINSIVEVIGRIYTTKVQVKVKGEKEPQDRIQRRLWVGPHEMYDTGYRSDFELPDFIRRPTIPKLTSLLLTGEEGPGD
jgi:hypothetical protein